MIQGFYNGLAGMLTFSRGLDNISNNIANMNTPGYRGTNVFYRSVLGSNGQGVGAQITGQSMRLDPGDVSTTNNATDLSISGQGYFILRDGDTAYYTRGGQFTFDENGILVDQATGYKVAGLDENGQLMDINISDLTFYEPEVTTQVNLSGQLSLDLFDTDSNDPTKENKYTTNNFNYINQHGEEVALKIVFKPDTINSGVTGNTRSFNYHVETANGTKISDTFKLEFIANQLLGFGSEAQEITIPADHNGRAGKPQTISLSFKDSDSFRNINLFDGDSNITVQLEDGTPPGGLLNFGFEQDGRIKIAYSNGKEKEGPRLALGYTMDVTDLVAAEGNLLVAKNDALVQVGQPGEDIFGRIRGQSLELSNVDLSQSFAEMIIVQRGYQASSNVVQQISKMYEEFLQGLR